VVSRFEYAFLEIKVMSKDQFLATKFSVPNFVPSVDLGAFDITLDPKAKLAKVLVRVFLEPDKPSVQPQLVAFGKHFQTGT
jgi:hypothetical protein